jgi:hypothetical protein
MTSPTRHYFVHPDEAVKVDWSLEGAWLGGPVNDLIASLPNPRDTYLVNVVMADKDEGQTNYTDLFDTKAKGYTYMGTDSSSKEDMQKRLRKPEWEDATKYAWFNKITSWLAAGGRERQLVPLGILDPECLDVLSQQVGQLTREREAAKN